MSLRDLLAVIALAAAAAALALEQLYRDAFIETARDLIMLARLPAPSAETLGRVAAYGPALVLAALAAWLFVSAWRRRKRLRAQAAADLKRKSRS
ncbi:MAG: hypothetical protein QOD94_2099 [Alphaproteobacteria bacterium]|nr:hypothetical protein [Alphaproteobacteria bacterium]